LGSQAAFLDKINSGAEEIKGAVVVLASLNYTAKDGKEIQRRHTQPLGPMGPRTLLIPQRKAKIKENNLQRSKPFCSQAILGPQRQPIQPCEV